MRVREGVFTFYVSRDVLSLSKGFTVSRASQAEVIGDYPHLTAERAEVAEIIKNAFSACFAASAVKENRINAVTFEHVGNHQEVTFYPVSRPVFGFM